MELPAPNSAELVKLIPDTEARVIYELLYSRRSDPPTMVEIFDHVAKVFGERHSQSDRRTRDLRDKYLLDIRAKKVGKGSPVYLLQGFHQDAKNRVGRQTLNRRQEAEVFSRFNSRCAMCGKSPKEHGVVLVIDHIVPLEWGGSNDQDNLQPLCEPHNAGKKAHFSSFDRYSGAIKEAIAKPDAHTRIGELLKAMHGKPVPVDLVRTVAREENAGDFTKRLRELRYILGWDIRVTKKKEGKRTLSSYTCFSWKPYPPGGAKRAVAQHEAERRHRKTQAGGRTN